MRTNLWNDSFSKVIIKPGSHTRKPGLCWECIVKVSTTDTVETLLFTFGELVTVVIGDADTDIDRFLEYCITQMWIGETCEVKCKYNDKKIKFVIELGDSVELPYIHELDVDTKLKYSLRFKHQGVHLFQDKKYDFAFYKFQKALKLLLTITSGVQEDISLNGVQAIEYNTPKEVEELKLILYNNLANCHKQFNNYVYIIQICSKVLAVQVNIKALFRRGMAYLQTGEYDKAIEDISKVLEMEPRNGDALKAMSSVLKAKEENKNQYKDMFKKMF